MTLENFINISNNIEEFDPSEINMEYFTIFINDVVTGKIDTRTHSTSDQIREYVQLNKNKQDVDVRKSTEANDTAGDSSHLIDNINDWLQYNSRITPGIVLGNHKVIQ